MNSKYCEENIGLDLDLLIFLFKSHLPYVIYVLCFVLFTVTNLMGLITMRLASDPILPLKYETYADELQTYALAVTTQLKSVKAPQKISISPLLSAISDLREACHQLQLELQVSVCRKGVRAVIVGKQ